MQKSEILAERDTGLSLASEPGPEVHNTVQSANLLVGGGEGVAQGPLALV